MKKVQFKLNSQRESSPYGFEILATVDAGNHNLSLSDHTVRKFFNSIYDALREMDLNANEISVTTIKGEEDAQSNETKV